MAKMINPFKAKWKAQDQMNRLSYRAKNGIVDTVGKRQLDKPQTPIQQRLEAYKQQKQQAGVGGRIDSKHHSYILDNNQQRTPLFNQSQARNTPKSNVTRIGSPNTSTVTRSGSQSQSTVTRSGQANQSKVTRSGAPKQSTVTRGVQEGENPIYTKNRLDQIKKTGARFLEDGKHNLMEQSAGRPGAFIGRTALKGAVWGGAIGGTVSSAQGGDFWEGAKEGAFKGAVGMTAFKGAQLATSSSGVKDIIPNAKKTLNHYKVAPNPNVSKPVDAIMRQRQNVQTANNVMNNR